MKKAMAHAIETGNIAQIRDEMNPLQLAFCNEYIVDFNAAEACLRAGYQTKNSKQMGLQVLKYPGVRILIDHMVAERSKTVLVDVDYVVNKIVNTIEKAESTSNHTAVLRGAELLAKYLGMFIERQEITGKDGEAIKLQKVEEDVNDFLSSITRLSERSKPSNLN